MGYFSVVAGALVSRTPGRTSQSGGVRFQSGGMLTRAARVGRAEAAESNVSKWSKTGYYGPSADWEGDGARAASVATCNLRLLVSSPLVSSGRPRKPHARTRYTCLHPAPVATWGSGARYRGEVISCLAHGGPETLISPMHVRVGCPASGFRFNYSEHSARTA